MNNLIVVCLCFCEELCENFADIVSSNFCQAHCMRQMGKCCKKLLRHQTWIWHSNAVSNTVKVM